MPAALLSFCLLLQSAPAPLPARPGISGTEGGLKAQVCDRQGAPTGGCVGAVLPTLIRANAWLRGAAPLPELRGPRLGLVGPPTYEEAPAAIVPLRREPGKIPMH